MAALSPLSPSPVVHTIGLMSGTSLDGVDGVLMRWHPAPEVLASVSLPLPAGLQAALLALNTPGQDELHRAAVAGDQLVRVYAQAALSLCQQAGLRPDEVAAVGAHGQTVRHHPPGAVLRGQRAGVSPDFPAYTLQLNQPALLAELTGLAVVHDFRSRDVAAGGQGAPLVPAFHAQVFGHPGRGVGVLNLGGMANLTWLPGDGQVLGSDTGPGNVLLDLWCQRHTGQPFDADGAWAASGKAHAGLLDYLLATEPYFALSGPKSTGRDLFNAAWLEQALQAATRQPGLSGVAGLSPADIQATLVELTAASAAAALPEAARASTARQGSGPGIELLVCGGGALNRTLMAALQRRLPGCVVQPTSARGWPVQWVEAAAFAWLTWRFLQGQHGNEPSVTGAQGPRILGSWVPA
ncbi:MAG: anhydro-N-acetylmuramic acid kinase [Serpentinimonas sp.]|nr:anhydro-N-acetylmuramic acid kinase [Serpentinimonas sp.]